MFKDIACLEEFTACRVRRRCVIAHFIRHMGLCKQADACFSLRPPALPTAWSHSHRLGPHPGASLPAPWPCLLPQPHGPACCPSRMAPPAAPAAWHRLLPQPHGPACCPSPMAPPAALLPTASANATADTALGGKLHSEDQRAGENDKPSSSVHPGEGSIYTWGVHDQPTQVEWHAASKTVKALVRVQQCFGAVQNSQRSRGYDGPESNFEA
eukprot:363761-Chlamydomonas_euryale.AAC.15